MIMLTQKQWKIQYLSERMSNIAISMAAEAARRKAEHRTMVKEHAIVAEELRKLTDKMIELVEQNIFNKLENDVFDTAMKDVITMSTLLALNAALVACKVQENKQMAVFAEEIAYLSMDLSTLYGQKQKFHDIAKVSPKSRVAGDVFFVLLKTISGKYVWCENTQYVNEIMLYIPEYIINNRLIIKNEFRNMDMPFIKLGDETENSGLIIISNDLDSSKQYAVLAEININILSNSHIGVSKTSGSDIPVRECWAASDGSEMIFPDWEKIANSK